MSEGTKYRNYEPDGLGDLKSIKRIRDMRAVAPTIKWGKQYKDWSLRKRLDYCEKLASTMNHAADMLQKERNELLEVCSQQAEMIKALQRGYCDQGNMVQGQIGRFNEETQVLNNRIVELVAQLGEAKKRIKELEE